MADERDNERHERDLEEVRESIERASAEALGAVAKLNQLEGAKWGNEQVTVEEFLGGDSAAHARRGRTAQKAGRQWEKTLRGQHDIYRMQRLVWLQEHALPTAPFPIRTADGSKKSGPMARRVTGRAPYDFEGRMGPGTAHPGRQVVIEAKSNAKAKKALTVGSDARKRGGLDLGQFSTLAELSGVWGVLALVLWKNGNEVGVLLPDRFDTDSVPDSLPTGLFVWLNPGSVDWYPVLDRWLGGELRTDAPKHAR